jgi:hypothetical protein
LWCRKGETDSSDLTHCFSKGTTQNSFLLGFRTWTYHALIRKTEARSAKVAILNLYFGPFPLFHVLLFLCAFLKGRQKEQSHIENPEAKNTLCMQANI